MRAYVNQGRGTLIDFMLAPEAEPWHTMIGVLDGTVDAWLRARLDPIRAAGCHHLVSVGWNWLHFAALPANRALDFVTYHKYGGLSPAEFNVQTTNLEGLRRAFPKHPLMFGEFGWSNQSGQTTATSHAVQADQTALFEAAMLAYLRANNFAGGFKWMLNDIQVSDNPYEANFGVFSVGDKPKPIRDVAQRFSQVWPPVDQAGTFTPRREVEAGLAYRLDLPGQITVAGRTYQDEAISWQAETIGHCFINLTERELLVDSLVAGRVSLDPWDLLPGWNRSCETVLYRVYVNSRTRQASFSAGQSVVIDLRPGAQYALAMGVETPTTPAPPPDTQPVEPKPGEHVVLFGDFENYVQAALNYLRRFAPDFTFVADKTAGRWPYITVIATAAQVSDAAIETMRGTGARLVERVVADTPDATKTLLDDLAARGQRFVSVATPPAQPSETPSTPVQPAETYLVQPGDTLGKIAQQVYGDFSSWKLIFDANRDKLTDPGLIRVGMELRLPEKS